MRRLMTALLLAATLPAYAQKPADAQPLPAVPPPPPGMEAFDAALEPQITITKNEREMREEYRVKGRLYMVKVTPAVGKPYYLIDQQGNGTFVETEINGPAVKAPMWVIHSW